MPAVLIHHSYGNSRVRLTRVARLPDRHEVRELTAEIRLEGDFEASHTLGDNSQIIAPDTMKNVAYALAQGRPIEAIEDFGAALSLHFIENYSQVRSVIVKLIEHPWRHISVDGRDHPHAFVSGGGEVRTAMISRGPEGTRFESGLEGLTVLKTSGASFSGFVRDRFTTLPETADRILAAEIQARWSYAHKAVVYWDEAFAEIRRALLETFARQESQAIQQTLHAMGEAALSACSEIEEISLTLPERHRIPFDLERFGRSNDNEIFVAADEPLGLISGTLRRV